MKPCARCGVPTSILGRDFTSKLCSNCRANFAAELKLSEKIRLARFMRSADLFVAIVGSLALGVSLAFSDDFRVPAFIFLVMVILQHILLRDRVRHLEMFVQETIEEGSARAS